MKNLGFTTEKNLSSYPVHRPHFTETNKPTKKLRAREFQIVSAFQNQGKISGLLIVPIVYMAYAREIVSGVLGFFGDRNDF